MIPVLGTSLAVFFGLTFCLMGFAAYMTGQALGLNWRPVWQMVAYAFLLGLADRFLTFALFEGELLSPTGYLIDTAVLLVIGLLSFRFNRVGKVVGQYPWLYERAGLFAWRDKGVSETE